MDIIIFFPFSFHQEVVNVLDCYIIIKEFELQSRYVVHFGTNTLEKGYETSNIPSYGLYNTITVLLDGWL